MCDDFDARRSVARRPRLQRFERHVARHRDEVDLDRGSVRGRECQEAAQRRVDAADLAAGSGRDRHGVGLDGRAGHLSIVGHGLAGRGAFGELVERQPQRVERIAQTVRETAADLAELGELLARAQPPRLRVEGQQLLRHLVEGRHCLAHFAGRRRRSHAEVAAAHAPRRRGEVAAADA